MAVRVLFLIDADDSERQPADRHGLAHRVGVVEEILCRLGSQHADLLIILNIQRTQIPAFCNLEIIAHGVLIAAEIEVGRHLRDGGCAAVGIARPHILHIVVHGVAALGTVNHGRGKVSIGRYAVHNIAQLQAVAVQVLKNILSVVTARLHGNAVGAHGLDLAQSLLIHAVDGGDDGHHRGNADDNTQHGQNRTTLIAQNGSESHFHGLSDIHNQSTSCSRSSMTFPSARCTILRAVAAMPLSWVIKMMVLPSWLSCCKTAAHHVPYGNPARRWVRRP